MNIVLRALVRDVSIDYDFIDLIQSGKHLNDFADWLEIWYARGESSF